MTSVRRNPATVSIALLFAVIVTWGFWQSYFGPLLAGTADRPWVVHLHAAVFTGWVLLLIAQATLAYNGRIGLHRQVGVAGMLYGAVVFATGVLVSVLGPALRVRNDEFPIEVGGMVAVLSLADLVLFGIFLGLAFVYRTCPAVHRQWIVGATAALGGAAVGRVLRTDSVPYLLVWLSPVLVLMAVELLAHRRLPRVSLLCAALIVVAFFKTRLLSAPIWTDLGRALLAPFV